MSPIEELIRAADHLCLSLEEAANNEKKFCQDMCFELERCSRQTYKLSNNIKQLKEIYGV